MSNGNTSLAVRRDSAALLVAPQTWELMRSQADVLVKSGFCPAGVNTAEKALAIMLTGYELGIPSMTALRSIHVISGRPTLGSNLIAALITNAHGEEALVFLPDESDDKKAVFEYKRRSWSTHRRYTYTIEMAVKAGLAGKDNWKANPAAMLRSRCISAIGTAAFADVTLGMYTPEEMGAPVQVDGATGEVLYDPAKDPNVVNATAREIVSEAASGSSAPTPRLIAKGAKEHQRRLVDLLRELGVEPDDQVELFKALSVGREAVELSADETRQIADRAIAEFHSLGDVAGYLRDYRARKKQAQASASDDSPATPEQVAALQKLEADLGWDEDRLAWYFEKLGVVDWRDLTVAQAAETIAELESSLPTRDRREEIEAAGKRLAALKRA